MTRKAAVAVVPAATPAVAPAPAPVADEGAVDALRRRLASGSAREHVVLDFLEDDLREARAALAAVASFIANVEGALAEGTPSQQRILSLALGGRPGASVEELGSAVASLRRRLAQVAVRM